MSPARISRSPHLLSGETAISTECYIAASVHVGDIIQFSKSVADAILISKVKRVQDLNLVLLENGKTIEEVRVELVSKLGENIFVRLENMFGDFERIFKNAAKMKRKSFYKPKILKKLACGGLKP